jgi:predicted RNA binding protein YcfA (HicA-like mRNA interferase family)
VNGFYPQIVKILQKNGWSLKRSCKGDHEIWGKAEYASLTVSRSVKARPLANAILKDAGVPERL